MSVMIAIGSLPTRVDHLIASISLYLEEVTKITLKPMHNIGKVSLNVSILYKNQEI